MSRSHVLGIGLLIIAGAVAVLVIAIRGCGKASELTSLSAELAKLGFTPIVPPSRLTPPGTIVSVIRQDPLHVDIACPSAAALGADIESRLLGSPSTQVTVTEGLSRQLAFDAGFIEWLKSTGSFKSLDTITLALSNVQLLEIPDDVVFECCRKRSPGCAAAIALRRKQRKPVSMIKAAITADATIELIFKENTNAQTQTETTHRLATSLGSQMRVGADRRIVGERLIWGIRDDIALGELTAESLPSTGLPERSRLLQPGTPAMVASSIVEYDLAPIKQPSKNTCWAATFAMMLSWKEGRAIPVDTAVAGLGTPWKARYDKDEGLPSGPKAREEFARAAGLELAPPATQTIGGYVSLLKAHGPLWLFLGDAITSHAAILVGVSGEPTFEGGYLTLCDPGSGSFIRHYALEFASAFEIEARRIVDRRPDLDLNPQIMYWPEVLPK